MKKKTERHHVLCLVLLGPDWKENIITITKYEHDLIHSTLNIPYYKIRRFRMKTNHLVHRNSQEFVNLLKELHLDFFKNTKLLPVKLQNMMRDSIRETTKRMIRDYQLILKLPKDNADIFKWLSIYHYCLILR